MPLDWNLLTDESIYSGIVLEKVCEYFYYNEKYKGQVNVPEMELPPELAFSLLEVADYLET